MFKRRVGVTTEFKRYLRRQRRKAVRVPAHLASGESIVLYRQGGWFVFSAMIVGPPYVPSKQIAGPFDDREEAQQWIIDNAT